MTKDQKASKKKPGPEPDRVKIEGDWEKAIDKALKKKRPEGGWPEESDEKSHSGSKKGRK